MKRFKMLCMVFLLSLTIVSLSLFAQQAEQEPGAIINGSGNGYVSFDADGNRSYGCDNETPVKCVIKIYASQR